MAILTFAWEKEKFEAFGRMANMFPVMNAQILGYIGSQGKKIMKSDLLNGQVLHYRTTKGASDKWHDSMGRRKVSYRIVRRQEVVLASYPANFFTPRARKLRNGASQMKIPLYNMLKARIESQISRILSEVDNKYIQPQLEKFPQSPYTRTRF